MTQIKPHYLWLGHQGDVQNLQELFDNGIQAVVQLAVEATPANPPHEMIFLRFPLVDGSGNDGELLNLAIGVVAQLIRGETSTLVCCGAGMSRSPAIVAAALSIVEQKDLEECLRHVTEAHPADVSTSLWEEICRTRSHCS